MNDDRRDAPSSEELARQARAGSSEAFARLVERHERGLFEFLRVVAGSPREAEELTQDAFVRAWTKLHLYDPEQPFAAWLYTVARRQAVSRARRRRLFTRTQDHGSPAAPGADPARIVGRRDERQNLWAVAERVLEPAQHAALWLRYADGLTPAQIAGVLSRNEATVRVQLFRARRRLARHLERPEESELVIPIGPPTPASASASSFS